MTQHLRRHLTITARKSSNGLRLLPLRTAARVLPHGTARAYTLLALNRRLAERPITFRGRATTAGFTMNGSTRDVIQRFIYVFGCWEPNLTEWISGHLRAGDVVVDVGANVGYFSLLSASIVGPSGTVYAIEPVSEFSRALGEMAEQNDFTNVVRLQQAATDHTGTLDFYLAPASNLGASGTRPSSGNAEPVTVRCAPVTDLVPMDDWPRVRLVKIDVEGEEWSALSGMKDLLKAMPLRAAVALEVAPARLAERGQTASAVIEFMTALGFTAFTITNRYGPRHYVLEPREGPSPLEAPPTEQTDIIFVKEDSGESS